MTNAMYQYRKCLRKRDYYNRRECDLEKRIFSESEISNSERRRLLKSYDFWKRKRHEWSLKTADAFMRLSGVEKTSLCKEVAEDGGVTMDYIVKRKEKGSPVMADIDCVEVTTGRNPHFLSKSSFEEVIGVHVYRHGLGILYIKVEESSWDRPGRCALELKIGDEELRITLTSAEVWSLLEFVNNSSIWTRRHNRGLYQYTIGSAFGGMIFYWSERGDLVGKAFGERIPDCLKDGGLLIETLESVTKFRDSLRIASQLVSCDNTYNLDGDRFTYWFDRLCLEDQRRGVVTLTVDARFDLRNSRDEVVWLEIGRCGGTNTRTVIALDYTSIKDLMHVYSSRHLTLNEGREVSLKWQNRDGWFLTIMMPKDGGRVKISTHSDMAGEWLVEYIDAAVMKALYDMLFKVAFLWRH